MYANMLLGAQKKHVPRYLILEALKTISSLLDLIDHMLLISEYVLEKQLLLILMKNLHKALHK